MRALARRMRRLNQQLGDGKRCRACGRLLDERGLWKHQPVMEVVMDGEPDPPQCLVCGKPQILRITFD